MRKVRNIVIGGIQQKVFNLVLVTILLLVTAYTAVIMFQSRHLETISAEANKKQKEAIAVVSEQTMDAVVENSLTTQTTLSAALADDLFQRLTTTVNTLSESAKAVLLSPELYSARPISLPDPATDGTVTMQLVGESPDMPEDQALLEKLGKLANLSDLMAALYRNAGTSSVYIAIPEGYMLCVDDKAGARVDESGKTKTIPIRQRPWYQGAAESDGIFFTDVLQDTFTGETGITCAMPIRQDSRLVAVAAADIFLDGMAEAVENSGDAVRYTAIINNLGHVVFSLRAVTSEEAQDLRQSEQKELAAFVTDALSGVTGVRLLDLDGDLCYLAGAPVETLGWAVVSVVDKAATERPTILMEEQVDGVLAEASQAFRKGLDRSKQTILVLILVILVLGISAANRVSKRIVKPLERMTKRVRNLGGKDLQFRMEDEYRTGDEIEVLAESFETLSAKTLQYVDEVQRVTAEKERIGVELTMATAIQKSQLPRLFPPFPNRPEFSIFAAMKPAKEVGGDFYDFFMVDSDHLALVMADVSGKGIPAALFMMVARVLIKTQLQNGVSVEAALTNVNRQLCEGNDLGFFVTVWAAVLEISTGKGFAVNAGHEHPVLKRKDGKYELVLYRHSLALAALDGVQFKQHEFKLNPGDSIFVYTDGVAEATNDLDELYGTDRMLEALNRDPDAEPEEVVKNVMDGIKDFVGEAEQFDDITMMHLRYNGS